MQKKMKKRFLSAVVTLLLTLSIGTTAFAAEPANSSVPDQAQPTVTEAVVEATEPSVVETIVEVTADGNMRTAIPSLATEEALPEDAENFDIQPRGSGYAADYTDSTNASFYITVSGTGSSSGVARMKAWDFGANIDVYASLYRPDGSAAFTDVRLPIGTEVSKRFSNFPVGQYRLSYDVYGTYKGWIYCDLKNN